MTSIGDTKIAVVAIGSMFPGSEGLTTFWRSVIDGEDQVREVPRTRWLAEDFYDPDPRAADKVYATRGAFLSPTSFDPARYGVPPKLLSQTDSCQLLSLMVADQVLADSARSTFDHVDRERISVVLGVSNGTELVGEMATTMATPRSLRALLEHGIPEDEARAILARVQTYSPEWSEATFPGLLGNVIAGRIANRFDLRGPSYTTDAACASSLSALAMAVNELRLGEADLVITGGADTTNNEFTFMCFCKSQALSPTGDCRPFAQDADGTVLGEGIGLVGLRRLDDAVRDGERIYAVIRGVGRSSDGGATSIYAPLPSGQAQAMNQAYREAGYGPDTVDLVEAHGTGTVAGDSAELSSMNQVFATEGKSRWCALGSIKSQIGHTKAAAGVAGLIKVAMALHHRVLPPTLKVTEPRAALAEEDCPFYLSPTAQPWINTGDHPRRASVSAFGFGGANYHVTLEEYVDPRGREGSKRIRSLPSELLLFSADSATELKQRCGAVIEQGLLPGVLPHLALDTQTSFDATAGVRLAIVASDEEDLSEKLQAALARLDEAEPADFDLPNGVYYSSAAPEGKIGVLFPGQGSQYVGMGADLANEFDCVREVWDREAANPIADEPLSRATWPRPAFEEGSRAQQREHLKDTRWAQPTIGAVGLATWQLLERIGLQPDCVAGHSFGELTALFAAGVWSERDFLKLARQRGEAMSAAAQDAEGPGAMIAVSAAIERVEQELASAGEPVVVANHNAPNQVVVSGPLDAIERVGKQLEDNGLNFTRLRVALAFHSPLMRGAQDAFAARLGEVSTEPPHTAVISNALAAPYPANPDEISDLVATSIGKPVRFVEVVEAMYDRGVRSFVEAGPSSVLTGLVGSVLAGRPHRVVALDHRLANGVTSLWRGLAQLAVAGHPLDLKSVWTEFSLGTDPRTLRPPRISVQIDGGNYARKYPVLDEGGEALAPIPIVTTKAQLEVKESQEMDNNGASRDDTGWNTGQSADTAPPHGANGGSYVPSPAATTHDHIEPAPTAPAPAPAPAAPAPTAAAPTLATTAAPVQYEASGAPAEAWLGLFNEMNRLTSEVHLSYQYAMSQSHLAFLQASETWTRSLMAMHSGAALPEGAPAPQGWSALPTQASSPLPAPAPPSLAPATPVFAAAPPAAVAPAPVAPPQPAAAPPTPQAAMPAPPASAPAPVAPTTMAPPAAAPAPMPQPAAQTSSPASAPQGSATQPPAVQSTASAMAALATGLSDEARQALEAGDYEELLLTIVADKTGYPKDILNMDMEFDADLGIDSIKRVEILASVQEYASLSIDDIDPQQLIELRTLGQVLEFIKSALTNPSGTPAAPAG